MSSFQTFPYNVYVIFYKYASMSIYSCNPIFQLGSLVDMAKSWQAIHASLLHIWAQIDMSTTLMSAISDKI